MAMPGKEASVVLLCGSLFGGDSTLILCKCMGCTLCGWKCMGCTVLESKSVWDTLGGGSRVPDLL